MSKAKAMAMAYNKTAERMHAAALAWQEKHRELAWGSLEFKPLGYPADFFVAAALNGSMIAKVGGNAVTRNLLDALNEASRQEATVAQAEAVIEMVFGIRRALTVRPEDLRDAAAAAAAAANEKPEPETYFVDQLCPDCGAQMDALTCVNNAKFNGAKPGDLTVCLECVAVLVFTADLKLRAATLDETNNAPPELLRAVQAVMAVGQGRRKT
jgi:hypothetical protein